MATFPESIDVDAETPLGPLLKRAAEGPVMLRMQGHLYRLAAAAPDDDIWATYDPDTARRALLDIAGSWSDVDADDLKAYIYRGRDEGTRQDSGM